MAMRLNSVGSFSCDQSDDLLSHHKNRNATDDERTKTLMCGLCEIGERAEGRCEQCNEYLCDGCIVRHIKLKVTSDHKIIPLVDFKELEDSEVIQLRQRTYSLRATKERTDPIVCRKHRGEPLKFYCNNCLTTICRDCLLTNHKNHITTDIEDAAEDIRQDLVKVVGDIKLRKLNVSQDREAVSEYKANIDAKFGEMSDLLRHIYQEMSTRLNNSYSELNQRLAKIQDAEYARIDMFANELENKIEAADSAIRNSEKSILSATNIELLLSKDSLKENLYQHLFDFESAQQLGTAEFFISRNPKYNKTSAENMIGNISLAIIKSPSAGSSIGAIHDIILRRECIFNIFEARSSRPSIRGIAEADGIIWVATSRSLVRVGMDGFKRTNVQLTSTSDITTIATGPGGKLLVAFSRGKNIKLLYKDVWHNFASAADAVSHMATTNDSQRVYVTLAGSRGDAQKIVLYGSDGKMKYHLNLSVSSGVSTASISCLTTSPRGDICVCDVNRSRVQFLNQNGDIINEYLGPDGHLSPRAAIFDSEGYVLVADGNRNNVQLITDDGVFLVNLLNREHFQDIGSPVALNIDHKGRLWVGTDMGTVCCYSYL
ncbi:hypothetical protein SNE40_012136 [Patella caerulea]|uniref:B box-type domain-containing protein n=1 Tax=Patella caerulea TaxID=87958 RepID=A0AAN8JQY2_PATCE